MVKKYSLFVGLLTLLIITGCSQGVNEKITGTWQAIEDKCDPIISDVGSEVTFYDDNTISGIEGFQDFKIKQTDNEDYDYAVLSGGYEDITKFRIKVTKDENLKMIKDEYDENFNTIRACELEEVSD